MSEVALFGIAKSVLQQIASPAMDEFRLLWDHKEQLERLEGTLTTIRNVLHDAERKQANDAVQGWLARLRVVLYEADDLFDTISDKVLHEKAKTAGTKIIRKEVRRFFLKPHHFAFFVKTAHKVKAIRECLDDIAREITGFNFLSTQTDLDQPYSNRIRRGHAQTSHSYVPSNEVVGREQEREDIVEMLLPACIREQRGASVVVVIGIGGLGKTTLAQLVYNDERVQQGFDLCMWACINYFSHLKQVLLALIKSATKKEPEDLELDQLQSLFRQEIEGKKFLLVLDDVWDEDPQNWHNLKILLDSGKTGSMILVTTRSNIVAQGLCATKPYHQLQAMSDESAWLLFKKIAFGEEKEQQHWPDLEQLGQQIVKKCANVPLAIVTIASLLRNKEKKKWLPLVNDELSKVVPSEYNKIIQILKISYNELSYPLKRCFAYCSLFPKDYILDKDMLVRLWIAQGFVEPCGVRQSLEDVAEEYFFCFVERCLFQNLCTEVTEPTEIMYFCRMHDMVHDLAMEVAGSESILVDQITDSPWDKTLHHMSLNCNSESVVDHVCTFSHSKSLRTFLYGLGTSIGETSLNKLISSFRSLRVLYLSQLQIEIIPTYIGDLIHLRLLDLSYNKMKSLPSSICNLHHLQSLILCGCKHLKELPEDIGNLLSLRHLLVQGCNNLFDMPPGLAAMTSLVALDRLAVHNSRGGLRYLECLDNLSGTLEIVLPETGWQNATMDAERSCLSKKSRLHGLSIEWVYDSEGGEFVEPDIVMNALQPHPNLEFLSILSYDGRKMSPWVTGLPNLVTLRVVSCGRCAELPSLRHLQSLKELHIQEMSSMVVIEEIMSYNPNLFLPSLQTLLIRDMPNLTSWWLQAPTVVPAFPRVSKVDICNCPKLAKRLPLFPLLEVLELGGVQEELIWHTIGSGAEKSVLKELIVSRIGGLSSIAEAQIRHLSALRKLIIYGCFQLESVSCSGLAHLTSLEEIKIPTTSWQYALAKEKLKWVDGDDQKPENPWGRLSRLRRLDIGIINGDLFKGLKYLTSLEYLRVHIFNEKLQRVSNNEEGEEDGMPWKPLQKLQEMELGFGERFSMRTSEDLLKGVGFLTSLQRLTLSRCEELCVSWRALLSLNHLQLLTIELVERVIDVDSTMMGQMQLSDLPELKIIFCSGEWLHDIPWKCFPLLQTLQLGDI